MLEYALAYQFYTKNNLDQLGIRPANTQIRHGVRRSLSRWLRTQGECPWLLWVFAGRPGHFDVFGGGSNNIAWSGCIISEVEEISDTFR